MTQLDRIEAMSIKPDDVIVISFKKYLNAGHREIVRAGAQAEFPNNKVVVTEADASISVLGNDERMARIEAKLDALLDALAEDDDEQIDITTMDGEYAGRERDESESLD